MDVQEQLKEVGARLLDKAKVNGKAMVVADLEAVADELPALLDIAKAAINGPYDDAVIEMLKPALVAAAKALVEKAKAL